MQRNNNGRERVKEKRKNSDWRKSAEKREIRERRNFKRDSRGHESESNERVAGRVEAKDDKRWVIGCVLENGIKRCVETRGGLPLISSSVL